MLPPDRPIASDLSYEVSQLRRLRGELSPQCADTLALSLHLLASVPVERRAFIGDPESGQPELDETPLPMSYKVRRRG